MNKWLGIAAMVLALQVGGNVLAYNEYAPNSFDEVERQRPAYQAAAVLIQEGLAPGYTDAFLHRAHLSRYEFAKAVKALLENHALQPQQLASLDVTKKEYARELEALGDGVERRAAKKFHIETDARLRYSHSGDENKTDARVRVGGVYHIR